MEDLAVMRRIFPAVADHVEDEGKICYGADLSTLVRLIEEGGI